MSNPNALKNILLRTAVALDARAAQALRLARNAAEFGMNADRYQAQWQSFADRSNRADHAAWNG